MCVGGRKNQLKASMLAIETPTASASPQSDRDRQDREDVEDAEAEHRQVRLEEPRSPRDTKATAPALASRPTSSSARRAQPMPSTAVPHRVQAFGTPAWLQDDRLGRRV